MALNIGNKVYRNLQEQVGYNSEQIKKIFEILDGIDYEDHVVVIENISVPLNEEQMATVNEAVAFLVYQDKLYFKSASDEEKIYFNAVIEVIGTNIVSIKEHQISVESENGSLEEINKITEVYSTDETDEKVAYLETVISNIGDASPKGVYATLADLETAFPTGASGIYIVSADGHWYFWDGGSWTDGGAYTSVINYDGLKNDIIYINDELTNPLVDLLPHISSCYKQGGIDNTASTRISTPSFISVAGYKRLYVDFTGSALAEVYIDTFTGEEGSYERFGGYGYYSADNYISIETYSITAIKITFRKPNNSNITPNEVETLTKNLRLYLTTDPEIPESIMPVKIRVLQYNIGKFNFGEQGGLSSDVELKIANYKKFLGECRADICCLEEYPMDNYTGYIPTIDSDGNYPPDETIFDNLYFYTTEGFFGNEQKTNINFNSSELISINEEDVTYRGKGIFTTYKIHGKSVGLISGWFHVSAPPENKLAQLQDCINRLQDYDIGIIAVDSNVSSKAELDDFNDVAKNAGYVCANGDYWGYFETLPWSSVYKCVDQVWVKGCKMVNVEMPDVFNDLSSDHLPLIADLVIQ